MRPDFAATARIWKQVAHAPSDAPVERRSGDPLSTVAFEPVPEGLRGGRKVERVFRDDAHHLDPRISRQGVAAGGVTMGQIS